jgi:hypothetical protein
VLLGGLLAFLLFAGGSDEAPSDQKAMEALAKESIEALPRGEWPSLYDDFTLEYQARCARPDFEAAGAAGAAEQGENLPLLRFVRLEEVATQGDSATAIIVGAIGTQSEYRVRGAFQRVDGTWKLAPAASTTGCAAFDRIESNFPSASPEATRLQS